MSDTDQVLESVADAEPNEPVVTEAPEEVAEEVVTEAPEEVAEEPEVTEEVAESPEEVADEPEPEVVAPEAPAPVTTQEVVQNVQEILSSTETNVSGNDLENRVKVLEERLESLVQVLTDRKFYSLPPNKKCDKIKV